MVETVNTGPGGITARVETPLGEFQSQSFAVRKHIPDHFHAGPYISFVAAGEYLEANRTGGVCCRKNDIILHPAGETHSNTFRADSKVLSLFLETTEEYRAIKGAVFTLPGVQLSFRKIDRELRAGDAFSKIVLEGVGLEIVGEILRAVNGAEETPSRQIARKAIEVLNDEAEAVLGLSEISRILGVEAPLIARSFKKETGQTVGEYLRQTRVEKAARLLADTGLPLCEVALEAGFYDQSHLTKVFKRLTGATPLDFRKRSRQ